MEQFNLYVHGVPIGHEVCPRDDAENYLKDFYSHDKEVKEFSFMQIDVIGAKSFYTYLHKKNVSSEIGRSGSYFGITVSFSRRYCTNVQLLYDILDTIYQEICVGCLIRRESGGERFLVKEIATAQYKGKLAVDYITAAFKQSMERYLSNCFDVLEDFSNSVGEVKFSLKEVDSPLFRETLKNRRILVSPEYCTTSVAYSNLLKELNPLKQEYKQLKQDNVTIREENKGLTDEVARLEQELAGAESTARKKYKKLLDDAQAKCGEVEKEKKELEDKIEKAASAIDQMDIPVKTLTRLLAGRFPEESKKGSRKTSETHSRVRSKNPISEWLPMGNFILLLCILPLFVYGCYVLTKLHKASAIGQKTELLEASVEYDEVETIDENRMLNEGENEKTSTAKEVSQSALPYDDFDLCKVEIPEYNGNGSLQKGKEYSLVAIRENDKRVANLPEGIWEATTNSNLPGIIISGNKFKVDNAVLQPTNVLIYYTVNGEHKLTKTIKVE